MNKIFSCYLKCCVAAKSIMIIVMMFVSFACHTSGETPQCVAWSWICTSSLSLLCKVSLVEWLVSLHCRLEPSSNQVIQPVYTKSVDTWKEQLSARDQRIIWQECDMLKELGYPPSWQTCSPPCPLLCRPLPLYLTLSPSPNCFHENYHPFIFMFLSARSLTSTWLSLSLSNRP